MKTDILIGGGGLSGLRLAQQLHDIGADFQLLEARDRWGGRIETWTDDFDRYADLGPAWFWPGQPRIAALLKDLGCVVFEQFAQGNGAYEDETGRVLQEVGFGSMSGSYRVKGGLGLVISRLVEHISPDRLHLGSAVQSLTKEAGGVRVQARTSGGMMGYSARRVIFALPPRVVAQTIAFHPGLPKAAVDAMTQISTWMAGQAKAVVLYDKPFWRDASMSGDAISRKGPMAEIHDASSAEGAPYALFGFLGIPVSARHDPEAVKAAVIAQLGRIFGAEMLIPRRVLLRDWAFEALTATDLDHAPVYQHPAYGMPQSLTGLWDDQLAFSSTEVADQFGGYLEGALKAADDTFLKISEAKESEQV